MMKPNSYTTIVFDLDGTLLDTWPGLLQAVHAVTSPAASALDMDRLRWTLSQGIDAMLQEAISQTSLPRDAVDRLQQHYRMHTLLNVRPYQDASAMLAELQAAGYRLGLCTNRDRHTAQILLDHMGWLPYFSHVQCLGDGLAAKPDPEPLLATLSHLDCAPQHALFVGDSLVDAQCAANAKVDFAAHVGGYHTMLSELDPAVTGYRHTTELMHWLLRQPIHALEVEHD